MGVYFPYRSASDSHNIPRVWESFLPTNLHDMGVCNRSLIPILTKNCVPEFSTFIRRSSPQAFPIVWKHFNYADGGFVYCILFVYSFNFFFNSLLDFYRILGNKIIIINNQFSFYYSWIHNKF